MVSDRVARYKIKKTATGLQKTANATKTADFWFLFNCAIFIDALQIHRLTHLVQNLYAFPETMPNPANYSYFKQLMIWRFNSLFSIRYLNISGRSSQLTLTCIRHFTVSTSRRLRSIVYLAPYSEKIRSMKESETGIAMVALTSRVMRWSESLPFRIFCRLPFAVSLLSTSAEIRWGIELRSET